jgi:hypothetical protein
MTEHAKHISFDISFVLLLIRAHRAGLGQECRQLLLLFFLRLNTFDNRMTRVECIGRTGFPIWPYIRQGPGRGARARIAARRRKGYGVRVGHRDCSSLERLY